MTHLVTEDVTLNRTEQTFAHTRTHTYTRQRVGSNQACVNLPRGWHVVIARLQGYCDSRAAVNGGVQRPDLGLSCANRFQGCIASTCGGVIAIDSNENVDSVGILSCCCCCCGNLFFQCCGCFRERVDVRGLRLPSPYRWAFREPEPILDCLERLCCTVAIRPRPNHVFKRVFVSEVTELAVVKLILYRIDRLVRVAAASDSAEERGANELCVSNRSVFSESPVGIPRAGAHSRLPGAPLLPTANSTNLCMQLFGAVD